MNECVIFFLACRLQCHLLFDMSDLRNCELEVTPSICTFVSVHQLQPPPATTVKIPAHPFVVSFVVISPSLDKNMGVQLMEMTDTPTSRLS